MSKSFYTTSKRLNFYVSHLLYDKNKNGPYNIKENWTQKGNLRANVKFNCFYIAKYIKRKKDNQIHF